MSRRAGLTRPSAGSTRQARPSTSTSNGSRGSTNGKGPRRSNANATQDRFSSQRERDRLRRAAQDDEDEDDEDAENAGGDDDEEDPEDTNAQDDEEDEGETGVMYQVPKAVRLPVSEGVLTFVKTLGKQETERRVNELVRLALFSEFRRQPIRREDISKKVLDKSTAKAFPHIFNRAQVILRSTFCYELAPIRAKGTENEQIAAQAKEAAKKQKSQQREQDAAQSKSKGKGKETQKQADDGEEAEEGGSKAPAKAWVLRSILPSVMTNAMAEPNAKIAAAFQEASSDDDDTNHGMMVNWDRAGSQLGTMGLTFLILSFILLNGRALPNDQLRTNLYRLGLSKDAPLPPSVRPSTLPDDETTPDTIANPSTLRNYMTLLLKQGYLEAVQINTPATVGGGTDKTAARGSTRRKSRNNNGEEDENAHDDNVEWKWGPRAEVEIGERGIAEWISEVYVCGGDDDEEEEEEGQTQTQTQAARSAGSPTQSGSRSRRTPAFTQTQNLSATQRKRRHAESQSLRKEIERAAGSQLVN